MNLPSTLLPVFIALLHASVPALPPLPIAETVPIKGLTIQAKKPPAGLVLREELGLLTVAALDGQVVHRTTTRILETSATITPGGDYLLMFPEGDHYAKSKGEKINTMMAYRSSAVRSEIWASTSTDGAHTWSEPRFVFANAAQANLPVGAWNYQCSYLDGFTEDGVLHLFLPHRWQQVLPLTIKEAALSALPTLAQLTTAVDSPKAAVNPVTQLTAKIAPSAQVVYKTVGNCALRLDLFHPQDWKPTDRRSCLVIIHGGGWTAGSPRSMYGVAEHCAKRGMVGVSVQYRLYKAGSDVSVFDCVKDARSAVRYVRAHATELGIDPAKIVVSGSSAGGHLATSTALFTFDEAGEDTAISCAPNALVLFSPVIDTSREGYGNAKVGARWEELSPAHQVRPGVPPTLLFHGTTDTTTPYQGAQLFDDAMRRAGNRCELVTVEGSGHTYMFKNMALYAETLQKLDAFLASLGFVSPAAKP